MKKATKRIIVCILALVVIIPVLIWGGTLIKNSILTTIHKDEIKNLQFVESEEPLPHFDWYRITSYSDSTIKIYYVNTYGNDMDGEYKVGGEIVISKMQDGWHHTDLAESVLWSGSGSADNYIWPYWYHAFG